MRAAPVSSLTRRAVSAALAALAGTAIRPAPAAEPTTLRASLEKVAQRPAYGIETADVYYPPWFAGRWRVTSALTKVDAPAGVEYVWGLLHDGVGHDATNCTRYVWHDNCEGREANHPFCREHKR